MKILVFLIGMTIAGAAAAQDGVLSPEHRAMRQVSRACHEYSAMRMEKGPNLHPHSAQGVIAGYTDPMCNGTSKNATDPQAAEWVQRNTEGLK